MPQHAYRFWVDEKVRDNACDVDVGARQASCAEHELPKIRKIDVGAGEHRSEDEVMWTHNSRRYTLGASYCAFK